MESRFFFVTVTATTRDGRQDKYERYVRARDAGKLHTMLADDASMRYRNAKFIRFTIREVEART